MVPGVAPDGVAATPAKPVGVPAPRADARPAPLAGAATAPPKASVPANLPSVAAAQPRTGQWWATVGGGAVAVAVGAGLAVWAYRDEAALNADVDARDAAGLVYKVSYADAQARRDSVNLRYGLGFSALGVGAAVAALGLYVGDGRPAAARQVAVGAAAGGVVVAARF